MVMAFAESDTTVLKESVATFLNKLSEIDQLVKKDLTVVQERLEAPVGVNARLDNYRLRDEILEELHVIEAIQMMFRKRTNDELYKRWIAEPTSEPSAQE